MRPGAALAAAGLVLALSGGAVAAPPEDAAAPPDSTVAPRPVDPVRAWTRWPPIAAAIAPDSLDDPQDILEKEEIIADRVDALRLEAARLDTLAIAWRDRAAALAAQLEVLEDLADVQLGGDLEFQQRLESVREDAVQAEARLGALFTSRAELAGEVARLRDMAIDYRDRAARLREEEKKPR